MKKNHASAMLQNIPHLADSALSLHYCRLLVMFAKRLDPDQARQIVGADLDPNCLMVFLKYVFEKKLILKKVKKKANIRNRYNQVSHITRDNIWKSDKNTRKQYTQQSQEVSPFPAGDYKAARNMSIIKTNVKHK